MDCSYKVVPNKTAEELIIWNLITLAEIAGWLVVWIKNRGGLLSCTSSDKELILGSALAHFKYEVPLAIIMFRNPNGVFQSLTLAGGLGTKCVYTQLMNMEKIPVSFRAVLEVNAEFAIAHADDFRIYDNVNKCNAYA